MLRFNAITRTRVLSLKTAEKHQLSTASASPPKAPPEEDPLRACGVPLNSIEAGPREPSGILRPEFWIISGSAILTGIAVYFISPFSASKSGHATGLRLSAGRQSEERREGYTGRAETAEEIADEKVIRDTAAKARKAALRKE